VSFAVAVERGGEGVRVVYFEPVEKRGRVLRLPADDEEHRELSDGVSTVHTHCAN
jgi:hypothetical protein